MSVLLPCFEAASHVSEALRSLAEQSFAEFEIVAVDDGSEDGTPELLREWVRRDPRLRVLRQTHRGIPDALELARRAARAPYLARMDADDVCARERLSLQARFLDEHADCHVVGSRVRFFPRACIRQGLLRYERWINGLLTHEQMMRDLFVESPLAHPSVMMRADAVARVGGYRDRGWPEDYDLWMRMALAGLRFAKLPETLLAWRDRPERASRRDPRYEAGAFQSLKEHYLFRRFLAPGRPVAVLGAGPIGKSWARRLLRRGVRLHCFLEVDPRKIGRRIHGAPVVSSERLEGLEGVFLLAAVGAPFAREEIRARLDGAGFLEGRDYVAVA